MNSFSSKHLWGGLAPKTYREMSWPTKMTMFSQESSIITAIYLYVDADIVEGWWDILKEWCWFVEGAIWGLWRWVKCHPIWRAPWFCFQIYLGKTKKKSPQLEICWRCWRLRWEKSPAVRCNRTYSINVCGKYLAKPTYPPALRFRIDFPTQTSHLLNEKPAFSRPKFV